MKLQAIRLSALLVVSAIFAACGSETNQPAPTSHREVPLGRLEISSAPAGATILLIPELEGQALEPQQRGQTPATIEVAPGKYTVHLEKPGYGYFQKEVQVKPNETIKVEATLKRSH